MSKIEEKIGKAASFYGNTHTKATLHLNRDVTPFDKHTASFNTYGLETAFEQGAKFALSHQWVSVEDALPEFNKEVLFICEYGSFIGYFNPTSMWFANGLGEVSNVTYWMPIPPLPEARKEDKE